MTSMKETLIDWTKHWFVTGEHLYRRILQLLVALALILWIALTWFGAEQRGEDVRILHTEQLARVILAQASHEARVWISDDNVDALQGLAEHLRRQEAILEVSIQDAQGQSLIRAGHDLPVQTFLNSLPAPMWAVPMVQPIEEEGDAIGFMRITFDYNRIMSDSRIYQRDYQQKTGFMLFLAVVAGMLFAAALLKRRPRRVPPVE
ncbi:hypothetical protein CWE14_06935 [Aliidiomarina soli]|uniref:SMP protein n=2 Tax=Aliidiomarina soli TaxID=1928574 RepID=A0A432WGV2_9GAMM|nr:hypothetical protein CWE14_06935 [Aliidiomarina soli]